MNYRFHLLPNQIMNDELAKSVRAPNMTERIQQLEKILAVNQDQICNLRERVARLEHETGIEGPGPSPAPDTQIRNY